MYEKNGSYIFFLYLINGWPYVSVKTTGIRDFKLGAPKSQGPVVAINLDSENLGSNIWCRNTHLVLSIRGGHSHQ